MKMLETSAMENIQGGTNLCGGGLTVGVAVALAISLGCGCIGIGLGVGIGIGRC